MMGAKFVENTVFNTNHIRGNSKSYDYTNNFVLYEAKINRESLVSSNEFIKVEIWKADVSSVSPSFINSFDKTKFSCFTPTDAALLIL